LEVLNSGFVHLVRYFVEKLFLSGFQQKLARWRTLFARLFLMRTRQTEFFSKNKKSTRRNLLFIKTMKEFEIWSEGNKGSTAFG